MKKVEGISELKKLTAKPGGERGNWMVRHVTRNMAVYFTWAILHTPITADGVVVISAIFGLAGGFLLARAEALGYILGMAAFHLWYIFDHVDGQVARYRKETNVTGIFFDYLVHYIASVALFFGLGVGSYRSTGDLFFLFCAFAACFGMVMLNVIFDTRAKAFFTEMVRSGNALKASADKIYSLSGKRKENIFKRFFSLLCKTCEIHVILNVLAAAAILNLWITGIFADTRLFDGLLVFYAAALNIVWISKALNMIITKKIDREYYSFFGK